MKIYKRLQFAVFILLFILFFLPNKIFSQTTGSIGGIVIDAKDKTPLAGAVVKIEGTQRGAETDANGEYIILNVDVGSYTVIAAYVGYTASKKTGVKVSVDLKTKEDFQLTSGAVVLDTLEVTARRKGIDVEQSGRLVTEQQIDNQGIRGIQNIAAKTSGVVQDEKGGTLNIRGGRSSENLIIVDGVATTNPIDGSSTAYVSNSQLQEISVLTGGFGAEYGNALAGVINVTTKSGSGNFTGSVEVLSDALTGKWINTSSQGYNLYSVTIGGPLIPAKALSKVINFFGGVERQFLQVEYPSWIADKLYENGQIPNIPLKQWSYSGRLNIDLLQIRGSKVPIQLKGGFNITDKNDRTYNSTFLKYDSQRWRYNISRDYQFYGRIVHNISSNFFYELQGNYYKTYREFGDPVFQDNLYAEGDTTQNRPNPVIGLKTPGALLPLTSTGIFTAYSQPYYYYYRADVSYFGGNLDATLALLTKNLGNHELKFGGEFRYHTLKKERVFTPSLAANNYDTVSGHNLSLQRTIWYSATQGRLIGYGYDIADQFGNQIMYGEDAKPKHPIIGAFYIRDKADFQDFSFNGGFRVDYFYVNAEGLKNPADLIGADGILLSDDDFQKNKPLISVSPRLGFSFPVTDKTVFVAQYGKFVQMPSLDYLYLNTRAFAELFYAPAQIVAGNSSLKPERLTSYEVGVKQSVGDFLNLGFTVYYKETLDQIGVYEITGSTTVPKGYAMYMNTDFGVSRGLDFYLSLRRYHRFAVDIAYTLLYASGTGSDPNQKIPLINSGENFPQFTFPLNYDQRHTGNINIDYRFGGDEDVPNGWIGQVLKHLGLNVLLSFNSGRPYTSRTLPTQAFSPSSGAPTSAKNGVYWPWNYSVDLKLDKTVNIWKTNCNFYIWVTNLLNSELINSVYEGTGMPDDDGFLNTQQGGNASIVPGYIDDYKLREQNPYNWGPPRQVRLGVRLSF